MTWDKRVTASSPGTPATSTRALDTEFTPSATRWTRCMYTIQFVCAAGTSATVELRSDTASPPTTVRASATLSVTGAGDSDTVRQELVYDVPPGHIVKLVSSGTGTPTIAHQTEQAVA